MDFDYAIEMLENKKQYCEMLKKNHVSQEFVNKKIIELQEAINLLKSQSGGVLSSKSWEELTEEEKDISLRYIKAHAQFVLNGDNKTLSVVSAEDFIKEMSQ